ncbi:hypothetical protein GCM10009560_15440 [Nonomuraea longicatena]|uniref:Uncharacterized protein n=1 Tax=Nonomuraea longicatena TaxID=83682 RepID=A0ABP3ZAB7_9ACTN
MVEALGDGPATAEPDALDLLAYPSGTHLCGAQGGAHALVCTRRAAIKEATTRAVSTLQYRKPRTPVTSRFSAR